MLGASLRPGSTRSAHRAAVEIPYAGLASRPLGDDPSRLYRPPRRGQSIPPPAVGGAMLRLLRLPC